MSGFFIYLLLFGLMILFANEIWYLYKSIRAKSWKKVQGQLLQWDFQCEQDSEDSRRYVKFLKYKLYA
ncbi:hypothetical protein BTA51_14120 [Hahella sp. CCB-MM4]|nr:hypothetical protein BTA51_14120 [Hahella sp. CCB-MM4]